MKYPVLFTVAAVVVSVILISCSKASTTEVAQDDAASDVATTIASVIEYDNSIQIPEKPEEPVVIDFNAQWCGPCRMFKPVFHKMADEYTGDAAFISIDIDEYPQIAAEYGVTSIPAILVINTDGSANATVGYMDYDQFKDFLNRSIKK